MSALKFAFFSGRSGGCAGTLSHLIFTLILRVALCVLRPFSWPPVLLVRLTGPSYRRALGYSSSSTCSAQYNGFTTLPPNVFSALVKLSTLYMQCLPIQTLPANTFTPLSALTSVSWCVPLLGGGGD